MSSAKEQQKSVVGTASKLKQAFVISPIGAPGTEAFDKANLALQYIFVKAFDPGEWEVRRADDGDKPDSIGHHVIKSIFDADLVIADLTDHNPNVFYELAIAHGYRKPVVHMITAGQKIPFDIVDLRTISYDLTDPASVDSAIERLKKSAVAAESSQGLNTPLTAFAAFENASSLAGENTEASVLLSYFEQMMNRISGVEETLARVVSARSTTPKGMRLRTDRAPSGYGRVGETIDPVRAQLPLLDEEERTVFDLLVRGKAAKEIAGDLKMPVEIVETNIRFILHKLNFDSLDELRSLI